MAFNAPRYVLIAGPDEVTVNGTSTTLAVLLVAVGSEINKDAKRLTLHSANLSGISWANGETAVDGVNQFPDLGMIEMDVAAEVAGVLEFVTDGTEIKVSVVQEA